MSISETGQGVIIRNQNKYVLADPVKFFDGEFNGIHISESIIKKYNLTEGLTVSGPINNSGEYGSLEDIKTISGVSPEEFQKRTPYTKLVATVPDKRFNLSISGDPSMRILDLIAPIAKGARGLIVSPPRAGKTVLLEQIAKAIRMDSPHTRLITMLIDERPEEVTHFRRNVDAEVLASCNDHSVSRHIALTEFVLAHAIAELEAGKDVVILVDSLTRMARAFNLGKKSSKNQRGKIMSGGLQAGCLETPRRFFGLARKIENGGSITIIATVLVDTGSRMDQLIFEEFKGTGNNEIILDRNIADARVYPAINIAASGTRKEEVLYEPHHLLKINQLRRALLGIRQPKAAIEQFLKFLNKYPSNLDYLNEPLQTKSS
jgi:transcription termination factor Rho